MLFSQADEADGRVVNRAEVFRQATRNHLAMFLQVETELKLKEC